MTGGTIRVTSVTAAAAEPFRRAALSCGQKSVRRASRENAGSKAIRSPVRAPERLSFRRLLPLLTISACAPAVTGQSVDVQPAELGFPPVPEMRGELRIDVVYPGEGAAVAAPDSTFIFGSTGRGDAVLTINGAAVQVAPNGAWLAFLPVPTDGVYNLTASADGETASLTRQVQVPVAPAPIDGSLQIVEGSVAPSGVLTGVRGERVEVRFRGTPGAAARLILPDGTTVPLAERQAVDRSSGFMLDEVRTESGLSDYVGSLELENAIASVDPRIAPPTLVSDTAYIRALEGQGGMDAVVELGRPFEAVQMSVPAAIGVLEPGEPRLAVAATARPDSTVIGRRGPGSDQAWDFFWPNGTLLRLDGETEGYYRVRLTDEISAWILRDDVRLIPEGWSIASGLRGAIDSDGSPAGGGRSPLRDVGPLALPGDPGGTRIVGRVLWRDRSSGVCGLWPVR
jgi:N-acetylmuramoyl-L-alanine amidase